MAFTGDNKRQQQYAAAESKEIKSLVTARGFDPNGDYRFEGIMNIHRKPGSISNGEVKGSFIRNGDLATDQLVFNRSDFDEKAWSKICAVFGYKYHVHSDINKFTVNQKSVEVTISLTTPSDIDD